MEFKIDTRSNYAIIEPTVAVIDANLAEKLVSMVAKMRQSGSNNFIVDLNLCGDVAQEIVGILVGLHEDCYMAGESLVFTGMCESVKKKVKAADEDRILQIAPTMVEAVDIVSMEILERDLMKESEEEPDI